MSRRPKAGAGSTPANEIARQLVSDGVQDAPMRVYTAGLKGCLIWRTFHKAAGYTFKENAQTPVKRVKWEAPEDAAQRYRAGQKQGVKAPAGTRVAREQSAA